MALNILRLYRKGPKGTGTIIKKIDTVFNDINVYSPEHMAELARNGKFNELEQKLNLQSDLISTTHPLFPNYGFAYRKNHLVSVPLTEEATKLFPPKYICTGTIKVGDRFVNKLDEDVENYAYRHQFDIEFNIVTARKELGEMDDPKQEEAKELEGTIFKRKPKEFPKPTPCKLIIDGNVYYEYIMLRIEEILDDGTYVISNREQVEIPYGVKIYYNIVTNRATYSMPIKDAAIKGIEKLKKRIEYSDNGEEITIRFVPLGEAVFIDRLYSGNSISQNLKLEG